MRTTIRQVAERAQVSRMTVSNVLRERANEVSSETRLRVLEAVRALNYIPVTPPARQGTHTPTRIIGLFYDGVKLDEYWGFATARGLHEGAIAHDFDLLTLLRAQPQLALRLDALDDEELRFLDRRSDGFIFLTPVGRASVLRALVKHNIPVVTAYTDDNVAGVSSVVLDNAGAMQIAVRHLRAHGHRKLAYVGGRAERSDFQARHAGFESAVLEGKVETAQIYRVSEDNAWIAQILEAVRRGEVTGIVCATDYFAFELINAARRRKMKVPRDFSIIGMDNIPQIEKFGLTTISYSPAEIGRRAVEAITRRLAGDAVEECNAIVPVELLERTSVAPLENRVRSNSTVLTEKNL